VVAAIRSGDEHGMAALYDRYSAVVYSVALRVLGDTGAAEDVLQEVFMQLWRNPGLFDSSRGSLGPWLAVIARHRAIDGLRKRRPETDIADVVVSVEPDMAGEAERSRAMEKVRGALGSMPPAQRQSTLYSYEFRRQFTPEEWGTLNGLMAVEPLLPPPPRPGMPPPR